MVSAGREEGREVMEAVMRTDREQEGRSGLGWGWAGLSGCKEGRKDERMRWMLCCVERRDERDE